MNISSHKEAIKALHKAEDALSSAEYDLDADITAEEALYLVEKAKEFVQLTKKYFN